MTGTIEIAILGEAFASDSSTKMMVSYQKSSVRIKLVSSHCAQDAE